MSFKTLKFAALFVVFAVPLTLLGGPGLITFQSRIVKPDGSPLEAGAVNFRFSVTDTVGSCVIYQEDFSAINMASSKGLVTLSLGAGSKVFPIGPMPLSSVFNNYGSPLFNCQAGGTINAGLTDRRKLVMQFHDGSGWQTLPAMDINSNPFAMQASNAFALGGFAANDFLRPASLTPCNPATHALTFNGTSFTCVAVGGSGGSVTAVSSANADIDVATGSSTPILTLNSSVTGAADKIVKLDASGNFGAINASALTNLNATNLASGTVPAARMPALTGDVTMSSGTTATTIGNSVITDAKVSAAAGIARSKLATGTNNGVVINNGSGVMTDVACANGQIVKWIGGQLSCGTDSNSGGDVTNNGNSFSGAMTIGTNDNNILNFETNGTDKMTILANGNVGVGTNSPNGILDVRGGTAAAATNATHINFIGQNAGTGNQNGGSIYIKSGEKSGSGSEGYIELASKGGVWVQPAAGSSGSEYLAIESRESDANGGPKLIFSAIRTGSNYPASSNTMGRVIFQNQDWAQSSRIQSVATEGHASGASGGELQFYTTPNTTTSPVQRMVIGQNGNVGIGTTTPNRLLEVAGPVRVAPSALPGTPAAGDIAIDSGAGNSLKYHNGSGWQTVGGGTVTGTGTTNAIPKFTAAGAIGDSALSDNGTVVTSSRAIASIPNTVAAASVNLSLSNTHTLASVGGSTISITGQTNGGVYNIVVSDTTSRTYTFSGCTTSFFKPANAATVVATRTIYGLMTIDNGAGGWDCYVTWSSGFQ